MTSPSNSSIAAHRSIRMRRMAFLSLLTTAVLSSIAILTACSSDATPTQDAGSDALDAGAREDAGRDATTDTSSPDAARDGGANGSDGGSVTTGLCALNLAGPFDSSNTRAISNSTGTLLYLSTASETRRYVVGMGGSCVLTLDTSFGSGGTLDVGAGTFDHLYATAQELFLRSFSESNVKRVWPPSQDNCNADLRTLVVSDDGVSGFTVTGAKEVARVNFLGGGCATVGTGVTLQISRTDTSGWGPNGTVLIAGGFGTLVQTFDPATMTASATIDVGQGSIDSIRGCGADFCTFDYNFKALYRTAMNGARKTKIELSVAFPSIDWSGGKTAGLTDNGGAYVPYNDNGNVGVARVAIP